jgi:excisionase family DNA binding protein
LEISEGDEGMYTVKELASFLKVSAVTVYRLTESKKINSKKIGGQLRFTKKDIAEYLGCDAEEIAM